MIMKVAKEEVDMLKYEKELYLKGYNFICGTDEAGRGPLVGPVVAGAVILPKNYFVEGLTDSKKISEKKRNIFFEMIKKDALSYGIGIVDAKTIDEINIYEASRLAMKKAIQNMKIKPDYVLTDAMPINDLEVEALPIIHGDGLSISIAAASILAKVTRDEYMKELDAKYPMYEFKNHKGYPTKRHLELLDIYGPMEEYRFSYKPVKKFVENGEVDEKTKV